MPRLLKSNEIEVRVGQINKNGCSLLLYLDARSAMRILDESYGEMGWQRTHEIINGNLFCNISVYDKETQQWITKQDVGIESYTEKEKGEASDSFKRSCINWGIGRELYTSPFIWVKLSSGEVIEKNGKYALDYKTKFKVREIEYTIDRRISKLIIEDGTGQIRYSFLTNNPITDKIKALFNIAEQAGYDAKNVLKMAQKKYHHESINELTDDEYSSMYDGYSKLIKTV